jgi:hypothetical protein
MRKLIVAWALFGLALVPAISCVEAVGQFTPTIPPCPIGSEVIYQYAVKVVQGKTEGLFIPPFDPLGAGLYRTSVNVHNPSASIVDYRIKLAIAGHNGLPGPITPFVVHQLASDEVTQYDGVDFDSMLLTIPAWYDFFEGYFVIESKAELDVVAVYTGSILEDFALATMETERVPARLVSVPCCVRLDYVTISTGPSTQAGTTPWQSPWLITEVPGGSTLVLGDAPLSNVTWGCGWPPSPDPSGVAWIGTDCPGGSTGPTGPDDYVYTLYFCLCCDYRNVVMNIEFWAVETAQVFLNDDPVSLSGPLAAHGSLVRSSMSPNDPNFKFLCGMNHLDIHVEHTNAGPSGLMVQGWINADSGGYCGGSGYFPIYPFP